MSYSSGSGPWSRPAGQRSGRGRSGGAPTSRGLWGRTGYVLSCLFATVVLLVSGICYFVVEAVASIGGSHAIVSGPSIGTQNILLMGLESRRDWAGNILPNWVLGKLHAGSRQGVENGVGGNDTNTLILIHIPAGGRKAIGFSIPRDDWVNFADTVGPQQAGKIDQAYGVSMYYEQAKLRTQDPHMSQDTLAYLGNEAGRRATVATVEQLTGVHIDHFAEVNLDGFYMLARVFGGVQVCLRHAVNDSFSGAHFRAGLQHLDAAQALAFVRQRHGLSNGDLDRTHRQQAFIDSVMHQLKTEGIVSDLTKISALLSVAKHYVITDSGWNLLDFATQMRGLTSGNLVFRTLPIKGYGVVAGQDVNVIQPDYIKAIVHAAFYPRPHHRHHARTGPHRGKAAAHLVPAGQVTVDVFNGGSTPGLAANVSAALVRAGYVAGQVSNTSARTVTAVRYGSGVAANAAKIAALFHVTATASASAPADHIEILLGAGATVPVISTQPGTSPSASASPTVIPSTGPQGGAVSSKNGIPCVN